MYKLLRKYENRFNSLKINNDDAKELLAHVTLLSLTQQLLHGTTIIKTHTNHLLINIVSIEFSTHYSTHFFYSTHNNTHLCFNRKTILIKNVRQKPPYHKTKQNPIKAYINFY